MAPRLCSEGPTHPDAPSQCMGSRRTEAGWPERVVESQVVRPPRARSVATLGRNRRLERTASRSRTCFSRAVPNPAPPPPRPRPFPVFCVGARASRAVQQQKGQGLGLCNNSVGTPWGARSPEQGRTPRVSGTGARGSGWGRRVPLPLNPGVTWTGRGALRADNRENQKPVLLLILLPILRVHDAVFHTDAVALLLSFYPVVFIKCPWF